MELTGTGLENGHPWELIPLVNNKCRLVCRHCGLVRRADGRGVPYVAGGGICETIAVTRVIAQAQMRADARALLAATKDRRVGSKSLKRVCIYLTVEEYEMLMRLAEEEE